MNNYTFYRTCVNWPRYDVHAEGGLVDMVADSIEITRRTFLSHVDQQGLREIAEGMGFAAHPSQGLTMAGDPYVTYHRSKLHDKRVYYVRWSATEYVFTKKSPRRAA